jgi:hypothetical protein
MRQIRGITLRFRLSAKATETSILQKGLKNKATFSKAKTEKKVKNETTRNSCNYFF